MKLDVESASADELGGGSLEEDISVDALAGGSGTQDHVAFARLEEFMNQPPPMQLVDF